MTVVQATIWFVRLERKVMTPHLARASPTLVLLIKIPWCLQPTLSFRVWNMLLGTLFSMLKWPACRVV